MEINSVDEIQFKEIENKIDTPRECDDACLFHEYDEYEPLREVYNLSKMIVHKPKEAEVYDWYIVNIFGYEYTHGYLFNMPECEADDKTRKLKQDNLLEPIKQRYLNEEVIAQLLAFDINPARFWYALLWLMQYVNEKAESKYVKYRSASECIEEFIDSVNKETEGHSFCSIFFDDAEKLTCTIRLETHERNGKNVLEIRNPLVASIIGELLSNHLNEVKDSLNIKNEESYTAEERNWIDHELEQRSRLCFANEDKEVNRKYERLYLFRKFLTPYLRERQPQKRNKRINDLIKNYSGKNYGVSVNKDILIARLLWVVGFIPEDEYEKWTDKDALRVNLKGYEGHGLEDKESITYEDTTVF